MKSTMEKMILTLCLFAVGASAQANWTFENAADWPLNYPDCGRKYQEPQDIPYETIDACFQPFVWKNLEWPQNNVRFTNNYRSLYIFLDLSYPILVAGGPLAAQTWYYGTRLSFRFGVNDTIGSERTIRGRSYPVEVKLDISVERDAVLTGFANSESNPTISWMVEVSPDSNPYWDSLLATIPSVAVGGTSAVGSFGSLASLLPHYEDWENSYFTYAGSSSTPPCRPDATRIIYATPIPLSSAQIAVFRQVSNENGVSFAVNGVRRPMPPTDNRAFFRSFH